MGKLSCCPRTWALKVAPERATRRREPSCTCSERQRACARHPGAGQPTSGSSRAETRAPIVASSAGRNFCRARVISQRGTRLRARAPRTSSMREAYCSSLSFPSTMACTEPRRCAREAMTGATRGAWRLQSGALVHADPARRAAGWRGSGSADPAVAPRVACAALVTRRAPFPDRSRPRPGSASGRAVPPRAVAGPGVGILGGRPRGAVPCVRQESAHRHRDRSDPRRVVAAGGRRPHRSAAAHDLL